ncbi:MAG: hypothetical protein Q8R44_20465 [Novosphingobium sp.]|nr:hypothetical protein [Novosphingobium sp.]
MSRWTWIWTLALLALAALIAWAWIDGGRRQVAWIEEPIEVPADAQ